jgi:hypothetical protein
MSANDNEILILELRYKFFIKYFYKEAVSISIPIAFDF